MNTATIPMRAHAAEWTLLLPHLFSWRATCCVVLAVGALRLLSEISRRGTLICLVTQAPEGTVVVQGSGWGGPEMWVHVSNRSAQEPLGQEHP